MIFKELINELKKVKTEEDITQEIVELLTDITIVTNMDFNQKLHGVQDPKQIFNMTRAVLLNHFDNILLDISEIE